MRIRLRTGMAGHGFSYAPGKELRVPADIGRKAAERLVARDLAEWGREDARVEITVAEPVAEKAARRTRRRRDA